MPGSQDRTAAFKIRPVSTCCWLDREPTDPSTYLDSIPAQGWSATSAGNTQVTAARVLLASRQPLTGQRRTWRNPAPARP